jgi:hypothetical protein
MNDIQLTLSDNTISYLNPLFWQRGEDEQVLRNEIIKMNENGISSFIVEARPHPDYLGERWCRDLGILVDEAKKKYMKV